MNVRPYKELLDLLQDSYERGEPTAISHIFSGDKEIGRLIVAGDSTARLGDLSPTIYKRLEEHLHKVSNAPHQKRISEFLMDGHEPEYRIVTEVLEAPACLYIFGAGHVGQAVAMIGALAGYRVVVVDDRKEFLTSERFPNPTIELREEKYDQIRYRIEIPRNSAVVIVTRGHQYDEICLKQIINMKPRYVGMIGSRRRVIAIFQRLVREGINKSLLESVHAPIGLKIGAISPQEIAIAIMAEIINVMSGCNLNQDHERRELR